MRSRDVRHHDDLCHNVGEAEYLFIRDVDAVMVVVWVLIAELIYILHMGQGAECLKDYTGDGFGVIDGGVAEVCIVAERDVVVDGRVLVEGVLIVTRQCYGEGSVYEEG